MITFYLFYYNESMNEMVFINLLISFVTKSLEKFLLNLQYNSSKKKQYLDFFAAMVRFFVINIGL